MRRCAFIRRDVSSSRVQNLSPNSCLLPWRSLSAGWFAASGAPCDNFSIDTSQMIALDVVVLRDDLDPRLGQRDSDLIVQYAEIFAALPPIELNQDNVLIEGWHRVRAAERAGRTELAYVVVEISGDDDLADRMWAANLKHGVQYSRAQHRTQGLKLHGPGLKA